MRHIFQGEVLLSEVLLNIVKVSELLYYWKFEFERNKTAKTDNLTKGGFSKLNPENCNTDILSKNGNIVDL